ncbi:MAG: SPOR domain-containing protein [Melioribacteraceae bacterium]|nr:SPOR domain-containing protein [Melioribacteraceae bacterium]
MKKTALLILLGFTLTTSAFAQEVDIDVYLSMVEKGDVVEANNSLLKLIKNNPDDLNVLYLDAVLTTDGEESLQKYLSILEKSKNFTYADAVLYKIFSYYYSLGIYKKAGTYLDKLKSEFPNSQYIKAADRTIPDQDLAETAAHVIKTETHKTAVKQETEKQSYKFTIQAGAFLSEKNAKNLKQKFESENQYAEIHIKDVGGSLLNVVTVGQFENKSSAQNYLDHIKKIFKLNGRIIEID